MIEALRSWLTGIVAATVLVSVAESIIPEGSIAVYKRQMMTLVSCKEEGTSSSSQGIASAASLQSNPVQVPEPPQEPAARNPLTGMGIDPEKADDRPVAVMLNNLKASLPQLGVSKADIIYEVLAEGDVYKRQLMTRAKKQEN